VVSVITDVVSAIEAAYGDEPDDPAWLRRIAEVAARHLDQGFGAYAYLYDVSGGTRRHEASVVLGMSDEMVEGIRQAEALRARSPAELTTRMYRSGPACQTGSSQSGLTRNRWRREPGIARAIETTRARDSLGLVTGDPSGIGCAIQFPKREIGPMSKATTGIWTRVAAHLAAAYRMRRAGASASAADAVLSPSGRVEHAEPAAQGASDRSALSRGAKRMDLARGKLRRDDPRAAVDLWRALVAGRWSLVDHFDHDGRRFLLARRNEHAPTVSLGTLSPRQRDVLALAALGYGNKLIGYQLGLTPSAVAMILTRAAQRLRVRSRLQLIATYRRTGERSART
jgi:DNA-binding CsgD family transcriptional regulator